MNEVEEIILETHGNIESTMGQSVLKRDIIAPSLELIRTNKKIKNFYFFPGFLSVTFITLIISYQIVFTYILVLGYEDRALQMGLDLMHSKYLFEVIIFSCIAVIVYIASLPIFEGGLIKYLHSNKNSMSRGDALGFGIVHFRNLIEFSNFMGMFGIMTLVGTYIFSLRFFGLQYITIISLFFGIALIFSFIINVLFSYAKYEIVLQKKGFFQALGTSSQIALTNMKITLQLYMMMIVMNIRVIINFLIFLIFPILVSGIIGFFSSQFYTILLLSIVGIIFLFILLILSYMAGVFEVFRTSVWYKAYIIGKEKLDKDQ